MGRPFWAILAVLVWTTQAGSNGVVGVQGVLGTSGSGGMSENYVLRVGILGLPVQTGEVRSSGFRLTSGILLVEQGQTLLKTGDFNGDGNVGFADFVIFARGYGISQGQIGYDLHLDLDGDQQIAFGDFVIFAQAYGR
ncbi:MAG: hypothetical protein O2954_00495 [bacterium]|nr:hypothetical protein [bacterium]